MCLLSQRRPYSTASFLRVLQSIRNPAIAISRISLIKSLASSLSSYVLCSMRSTSPPLPFPHSPRIPRLMMVSEIRNTYNQVSYMLLCLRVEDLALLTSFFFFFLFLFVVCFWQVEDIEWWIIFSHRMCPSLCFLKYISLDFLLIK